MMRQKLRGYYQLTKPGVLYGNVITLVAGFLFGALGDINLSLLLFTTIGTTLVIASACVINNFLDQDIDSVMERTKNRPLINGTITGKEALVFGVLIGVLGVITLLAKTNILVLLIGIIGFIVYVWLYGALSKRRSVHGTLVGSISGAMPITAGYVAATGTIDAGAIVLFFILFIWQMPEFYSISIFRKNEYAAARVPVISVVKGVDKTIRQIFIYTVAFVVATLALYTHSTASMTYLAVMLVLGMRWINIGLEGLVLQEGKSRWARDMFRFSLVILVAFSILISVDYILA